MTRPAMATPSLPLPTLGYRSVTGLFVLIAIVALALSDLAVSALNPWAEMRRLVAGLIRPESGRLRVFGRAIERLTEEELLPLRRRMGYVFQGAALFDSLSVRENVAYPLREHTSLGEAEIEERVVGNLSVVGLSSDVLDLLPSELSGGMRKRVGIARALSVEPEMLLFDEPTAGLDPTNSKLVADLMLDLRGGVCDTAMVVSHDIDLARTVADRVAVLIEGRFAAVGPAERVLSGDDPAVRAFLAGAAR